MVRLPILLLMAAAGPTLAAQTPLTLAQFEKTLPALHAMHDDRAAHALAGVRLTERASPERAARWQSEMPGRRSMDALTVLVDGSGFLEPPADERPATPPPDVDAQKQMLARAVDQVEAKLHKMPDFYAVRTTTHFETATAKELDGQQQMLAVYSLKPVKLPHHEIGPLNPSKPELDHLYLMTSEEQTVTYRDGEEVEGPPTGANVDPAGSDFGPTTKGEFGPILHVVLEDALQRGLTWSRWEQGASGALAVFHYDVPRDASHYEIVNQMGEPPDLPAYHGELALDPASGDILRITIQSTSASGPSALLDSNILVEYGPVDIGGLTYTCPVHGVVITTTHAPEEARDAASLAPRPVFLNDITFTGYHVFRGETRILPATQ